MTFGDLCSDVPRIWRKPWPLGERLLIVAVTFLLIVLWPLGGGRGMR